MCQHDEAQKKEEQRNRLTPVRKAPSTQSRWHALWHVHLSPLYLPSLTRLYQVRRQSEDLGSRRCRRRLYLWRMREGGQLRWWYTWRAHSLRTDFAHAPIKEL